MVAKIKNILLAASAGMVLGSPAMARSTTNTDYQSNGAAITNQIQVDSFRYNDKERTGTEEHANWVVRTPVGDGSVRNTPFSSLDEALSDSNLKNNIYDVGVGGGATPLKVAVLNNDLQLMRKCLDAGVNPDIGRENGKPGPDSPLAQAVNNYSILVKAGRDASIPKTQITALLEAGANPNIATTIRLNGSEKDSGKTPLHTMAELRDGEMIDLLIAHGADVTAKDAGKTPLDVYNSELTNLDGSSPTWRGEKNSETAQNLTPEKKGFSMLGWMARNSGR